MSNTLNVHLQGAMGGGQGRAVHDKGGGKFSCCDLVGNEPQRDTLADRAEGLLLLLLLLYTGWVREKEGQQEDESGRDSTSEFRGSRVV